MAWSKKDDIEESKMWYEELLNMHPKSMEAVKHLIKIAREQQDEEKEQELLKKYYKLRQDEVLIYKEKNTNKKTEEQR